MYIQKFGVYEKSHYVPPKDHWEGDNIKYNNMSDHNGDKGKPPFLGPSMLPLNLLLNPNLGPDYSGPPPSIA